MRGMMVLLWLLGATSAAAGSFCDATTAELAALPATLAGEWQGKVVQGVAVDGGKPKVLPGGAAAKPAILKGSGTGLTFSDATMANKLPFDLVKDAADWDYALPGESPLYADELLAPLLEAAGIDCPVADIPTFKGVTPAPGGLSVTFHAYALSKAQLLVVMQVAPMSKTSAKAVRAVLGYAR